MERGLRMNDAFFKSIAVGVLTTIFGGLVIFLSDFFYQNIPLTNSRLDVLENKFNSQQNFLEKIDQRTEKIYDILLERKTK